MIFGYEGDRYGRWIEGGWLGWLEGRLGTVFADQPLFFIYDLGVSAPTMPNALVALNDVRIAAVVLTRAVQPDRHIPSPIPQCSCQHERSLSIALPAQILTST